MRFRYGKSKMSFWIGVIAIILFCVTAGSCVSISDGTWYIKEAKLPQGWPALTPVGQVEVKQYPAYRAAVVHDAELPSGGEQSMFRILFRHIKDRQIAMTAPVEIGYAMPGQKESSSKAEMVSMAFLYRQPAQGQIEADGPVSVRDLPGRTHASIGVRGGYTQDRFNVHLKTLDIWLDEHSSEWQPSGQPRYLGYNSPFIPSFMRYGEVQQPVLIVQQPQ
jgi:hypothetical protein